MAEAGAQFRANYNLQDAAILNVIRACDTTIDLANMVIRHHRLGIPSESRDSFVILTREGLLSPELADRLKKMVGFRNLAVHQYRDLDVSIVEAVIAKNLDDLLDSLSSCALRWINHPRHAARAESARSTLRHHNDPA